MIDLNIVIVEDEEFLLKKISKVLKREIANVYSFKNPLEVLNNIDEIKPDIIISDINMPEMTGIDMYKELKNRNLNIPIILASAFSEPEYFVEAIKLKVKNFIVKPIDLEDLVDELKQFEKELLNEQEAIKKERMLTMQSKMAAMGEMLANIAHQWKQPLNTISVCTSTIQLEKKMGNISENEEVLDELTENILDSINYMNTTITDFQNYLKPNKLNSCFYIKDTLQKVDKLISSQINLYGIEIIYEIVDFHICGYQNELIQVLINIEKNAIDELKKLKGDKILKVTTKEKNDKFIIEIHDNAGGIPKDALNHIFEPFFTTKNEEGTGIGLYMSKQIIESHLASKIYIENETITYNEKDYTGAKVTIELNTLVED